MDSFPDEEVKLAHCQNNTQRYNSCCMTLHHGGPPDDEEIVGFRGGYLSGRRGQGTSSCQGRLFLPWALSPQLPD